jgi:triosephosphate isomerase
MIIVSNWKAYVEGPAKAKALVAAAKRAAAKQGIEVVIAPPAPLLGMFAGKTSKKDAVAFAAQDVSNTTGGAASGETTAALLEGMGVTHAIIGHSERRAMGESDELIASKVQHALAHGLTPIVCIGERMRDEDAAYLTVLKSQIASVYGPLSPKERMRIILAYEPVWAIGKSAAESIAPTDLHEMVLYLRKVLAESFPGRSAQNVAILYGGSVEPGNIRDLAAGGQVQGFLIGHASVEVKSFNALAKALSTT